MKLTRFELETDVLVIGGGCAGSMAAIAARKAVPRLKVTILEKGHIKRSGSVTMGMDALNVAIIPGISSPEEYVEMVREKCWGVMDDMLSFTLAQKSFNMLKQLENWGVFFPKDAMGNYNSMQVDVKGRFCVGMDEPDLKIILEKKVKEAGIQVLNKTMAIKLLVREDKVIGAIGLDKNHGRVICIKAKSIIMANGSAGRFGLPNTGYLYGTYDFPGNAGDGFALAFRAGAKLTGMEYTLKRVLVKDLNIPLIYIVLTRGGQIINAQGQVIADQNNPSSFRLVEAFAHGHRPFFLKTDHLAKEKIREIENVLFSTERPMQRRYYKLKNMQLGRDLIELDFTEAQLCGGHGLSGIVIDEFAQTSLNGLFAAGDVSAVPMQHLSGALVFGEIAGERAAAYCLQEKTKQYQNDAEFTRELSYLGNIFNICADNLIQADSYEYKVRRIINEYLLSPKHALKLQKRLGLLRELQDKLFEQIRVTDARALSKAWEIGYILDCALLSATASLTRQESRWGSIHYRTDFPATDNENWRKHIDIQTAQQYPAMRVSCRAVKERCMG